MKRFLCFLLILVFLPVFSFAEKAYSPALKMKISDFIMKYNNSGSPLGSPLIALSKPYQTTQFNQYCVYWFKPDSKSGVFFLLLSSDPNADSINLDVGLDQVQIYLDNEKNFFPFVAVTTKCASVFALDLLGVSSASLYVGSLITDYYENNTKDLGMSLYRTLNVDDNILILIQFSDPYYFFTILSGDDI